MYAMVGHWIPAIERSRFMSSFQGEDKPEIFTVTWSCYRVHEHVYYNSAQHLKLTCM